MPPFILIVFLLVSATFITRIFMLAPTQLVGSLNLPSWFSLFVLVLVVSWLFGD